MILDTSNAMCQNQSIRNFMCNAYSYCRERETEIRDIFKNCKDDAMIRLNRDLEGKILDIGGGGEGVIGRLYQERVVAVDCCQKELDDAPDGFEKVLMDATNLQYADGAFDHVTFFFSLMFMGEKEQRKAVREAARVLKEGGGVHIWDCDIASAYPEPFCVDVAVQLPDVSISTTYGVGKRAAPDISSITKMCEDAGLAVVTRSEEKNYFHLVMRRI